MLLKKKQFFSKEIRRQQNAKLINDKRTNVMIAEEVNLLFQQYLNKNITTIPEICSISVESIERSYLQQFQSLMREDRVCLQKQIQFQNQYSFYCLSPININFISYLADLLSIKDLLIKFFKKTIEMTEVYSKMQMRYQLSVSNSRCFISSTFAEGTQQLSQSLLNQNQFFTLIKFWCSYLQKIESVYYNDILVMKKTFTFWIERAEIENEKSCYQFIGIILKYYRNIKPATSASQNLHRQMVENLKWFATRVNGLVLIGLNKGQFREVGQILQIYLQNQVLKNGMGEFYFDEGIKKYILKMMKRKHQLKIEQQKLSMIAGAILLNEVIVKCAEILNSNYILSYLQIVRDDFLPFYEYQNVGITILYNLTQEGPLPELLSFYESLNYSKILEGISQQYQPDYYDFLLTVLDRYESDKIISQIIGQCDLEQLLTQECRNSSDFQLFTKLMVLVSKNMQFYVDHYRAKVNSMKITCEEIKMADSDIFLKSIKEYFALNDCEEVL